ncbi:hypothetical protein MBLNU13_g00225t1 [Cladosporium sp. NU13]
MSHYSASRLQTLCRLGVEQLPSFCADRDFDDMGPFSSGKRAQYEGVSPLAGTIPVRTMPVPGKRCQACIARGQTVWVIPGKRCPQCGTEVN